ncbi:MAG: NAD-dependent epimerase/dehydratase family protein, partial [Ilumatobacteraceae bacterium]
MRILISGATGLIGTALSDSLTSAGHAVTKLVRREAATGEVSWDPKAGRLDSSAFEGCDAVINLSGANIGDKRWTDDHKRELLSSRIETTQLLAETMAGLEHKPAVFISGSAVGWYG